MLFLLVNFIMKYIKISLYILIAICSLHFIACKDTEDNSEPNVTEESIPAIKYAITNRLPHDTTAFTEGLYVDNNVIFESTGATAELPQTKSLFGVYDTITGKIKNKVVLDKKKYFGEGITTLNGKIYQLTYQTKIGFVYDAKTYKQLSTFTIPSAEGWGFTNDGTHLIMTDGSNVLTYLDPVTLNVVRKVNVSENNYAINYLNEVEFVNGYIYANIFTTNNIVKIDPSSGNVIGKMDCTSLAQEVKSKYAGSMEMNGIAYNATNNKFYVTGKMWPTMFELSVQ
jgi:glutaminyl-peptide cyclotransferase